MGFGDVKLMLFLGMSVGFPYILICMFLAFLLGALVSVPLLLSGAKAMKSALPFGTFLSVATPFVLLYGQQIFEWYLGIIGWR